MDTESERDRMRIKSRASFISALTFVLILTLTSYTTAEPAADHTDVPWIGERLVFEISWFNLKGGTAVIEASEGAEVNGRKVHQISAVTNSNQIVDKFHKVRDRVDSFIYADNLSSFRFKVHQEEGRFRQDKEIYFDYTKGTAAYTVGKETSHYPIPFFVQDALSSLYYLRTRELVIGNPVIIDVFDDKKLWQVEVQVLGKERIVTPAGEFDTVMVKPLLKFEGIFQRKGEVYVWLTDDSRRMPVRMKSRIKIGSVFADLVEYKNSSQGPAYHPFNSPP